MPTPPLSDALCQQTVDAMAEHGSIQAASVVVNINRSTFEGRLREARRRGFVSTIPPKLILKGQSTLRDADGNERARWDKTRLAGIPEADTPQLPDPKKIVKMSRLFDQTGAVIQQWISEKPELVEREALWIEYAQSLGKDLKRAPATKAPTRSHADLLAVYPVGDQHHGMQAWAEETGDADYDLKISEQVFRDASVRLIATCPPCGQALVPFLGDFLHYDSYAAVTPANKNLLDADGRYPKMVETGIRMVRHIIAAALERHKHVTVIFEKGNHDASTAAVMTILLACLYENEPRVTIDKSPMNCHYFEFGKVLLGTHHGDRVKAEKLPGIMAHDMPEAWGRTAHRLWLTGHVHHESRKEFPGCKVESFGVLAPLDAYASQSGYRSERSMKALVFHREHGEVERHTVRPDMFERAA